MKALLSRKFIVSMLVILSADVMLPLHLLTAQVWASVVGSVVALYVGSNVMQKATVKENPPNV